MQENPDDDANPCAGDADNDATMLDGAGAVDQEVHHAEDGIAFRRVVVRGFLREPESDDRRVDVVEKIRSFLPLLT